MYILILAVITSIPNIHLVKPELSGFIFFNLLIYL